MKGRDRTKRDSGRADSIKEKDISAKQSRAQDRKQAKARQKAWQNRARHLGIAEQETRGGPRTNAEAIT